MSSKKTATTGVLATSRLPAGIGLEVLDRLAENDQSTARVLLDWLREDQHLAGGDDPLAGVPFPRLWTKGKDSDAAKTKLAAAAILVMTDVTAGRGISILEAADGSVSGGDNDKTSIALALVYGYDRLRKYDKGVLVASKLQEQYSESDRASGGMPSFCVLRGDLAKPTHWLRSGYAGTPVMWRHCARWNSTPLPVRITPKRATLRRRL